MKKESLVDDGQKKKEKESKKQNTLKLSKEKGEREKL